MSIVSSLSVDIPVGINYSQISTVNNTEYFQGYTPTTLKDWMQGLFNSVYCKLTGCTMTGDLTTTGNITANTYFGDGSQLTGINGMNYTNVALINQSNIFSGNITADNIQANKIQTKNISISDTISYNYSSFTNFYDFNSLLPANDLGFRAYIKTNITLSNMNGVDPSVWAGTEKTSYGFLWAMDGESSNVHNNGLANHYIGFLFEIQTGETSSDVDALNLTWAGSISAKTYRTYVWNNTASAWKLLGATKSNTGIVSYSDYVTGASDLVDSEGKVFYLVTSITTQSGLYALNTDYISVEAITKSGQINFYNGEFDNQISIKRTSPNALLIKNKDDKTIFQVDTTKEVAIFGNAQSGGSIFADNNAWFKGTIGVGSLGEPNKDYIRIEGTTTENGYGISSNIKIEPSSPASETIGISSRVQPLITGNWTAGAEVIGSYSTVMGYFGGTFGNETINFIGNKIIGAFNQLYWGGGYLRASSVKGLEVQPISSYGIYETTIPTAYGIYIKNSEGVTTIVNQTLLFIEKPDIATNDYQVVLDGTGAGTGVWFGGYNGRRIYNDGTNLVFNTTTGDGYFTRNVSATGFITRTSLLSSEVIAKDWVKDTSSYEKEDGSVEHSAFLGYTQFPVTDFSRPEIEIVKKESCEYIAKGGYKESELESLVDMGIITSNNVEDYVDKVCSIKDVEKTVYPYTKMEEGVDLQTEQNVIRQALYEALQKIDDLELRISKLEEVK